ncbi:MAG TPA: hypothetical protein VHM90_07740 [Phycisphaerae bacterium]|jgi:hypothetical protein|nr:hypothetical protein [Phycisphaerae bacterium]
MKFFVLSTAGLLFLVTGCTTKVYNQPGPTGQPTVIERDRPVVEKERVIEHDKQPDVNVHIDH